LIITKWKIAGVFAVFGRSIPTPMAALWRPRARFDGTGVAQFSPFIGQKVEL
jgi:hypothetical protein